VGFVSFLQVLNSEALRRTLELIAQLAQCLGAPLLWSVEQYSDAINVVLVALDIFRESD
jgi:hypothetical protein